MLAIDHAQQYPRLAMVTSYCLRGHMRNGRYVHKRAAASVSLPLGKKVRFKDKVVQGLRRVRIEDTGDLSATQIDVWSSDCSAATAWGVHFVRYRFGW